MQSIPITKDEFIGRYVTITDCQDPTFHHVNGVIIDETQHTFLIQTPNKVKRIAKQIAIFSMHHEGNKQYVQGSTICFRPEDRIKKTR
jgi:RNase P/RNase MRP subunit p29